MFKTAIRKFGQILAGIIDVGFLGWLSFLSRIKHNAKMVFTYTD